jgi:hypothetical protein
LAAKTPNREIGLRSANLSVLEEISCGNRSEMARNRNNGMINAVYSSSICIGNDWLTANNPIVGCRALNDNASNIGTIAEARKKNIVFFR